jgi:hypothetical protein
MRACCELVQNVAAPVLLLRGAHGSKLDVKQQLFRIWPLLGPAGSPSSAMTGLLPSLATGIATVAAMSWFGAEW